MNLDFSWLACVISGSVSLKTRAKFQSGEIPLCDFAFLARHGATLFTADDQPQSQRLLHRLVPRRFAAAHAVAEQAKRFRVVLCIADDIGIPVQISMALHRCRTPLLIGVHGHYLQNRKFRLWARTIRGRKDVHLLAISDAIREALLADHAIPPDQCTTLCPPVDTDFFKPVQTPPEHPDMILSAGAAHRDYQTFIAIMPKIDAHFRIASGSNWTQEANSAEVPANCEMGRAASMQELRSLYAAARVVVLPLQDAFHASGIAVATEAMAMGKPLIITRTKAVADFFFHEQTCLLVPPCDSLALHAALTQLLSDVSLQQRLGTAAREIMAQDYSLTRYAQKLTEIVARVQSAVVKTP